jgi:HAD superfamily hydrolase (TIGR01549 family)
VASDYDPAGFRSQAKAPPTGSDTGRNPPESQVPWGIFLDLDDTLVLTSALESLRRRRAWNEVYNAFGLTSVPSGTHEFIRALHDVGETGVITTAPRTYAERLLRYHRLPTQVVVAYHDVSRQKPDPEPILVAANRLGLRPDHAVYVGDSTSDVTAARSAGAHPLVVDWMGKLDVRESSIRPVLCHDWNEVLRRITALTRL